MHIKDIEPMKRYLICKFTDNEFNEYLSRRSYLLTRKMLLNRFMDTYLEEIGVITTADVNHVAEILKALEEVEAELQKNEQFHSACEEFCRREAERFCGISVLSDEIIPEKYREEALEILMRYSDVDEYTKEKGW